MLIAITKVYLTLNNTYKDQLQYKNQGYKICKKRDLIRTLKKVILTLIALRVKIRRLSFKIVELIVFNRLERIYKKFRTEKKRIY